MQQNKQEYPFQNTIIRTKRWLEAFNPTAFRKEVKEFFRLRGTPQNSTKIILYVVAAFLTTITVGGALLGYVRGYNKFMRPKDEMPRLNNLPHIMVFAMLAGSILIWVILIAALKILIIVVGPEIMSSGYFYGFLAVNLLLSIPAFFFFNRWRDSTISYIQRARMHGSAKIAGMDVIEQYTNKPGLYIGGGMTYSDKAHLIGVAGSRSGKNVNFIVANILNVGKFKSSSVVIDPKGELASICAKVLQEQGRKVLILNPWEVLSNLITGNTTYNPFDFLADKSSEFLIDDVKLIADLICPVKEGDHNSFFTSSAANIISALLLFIAVTMEGEERSLGTLWQICRKSGEDWDNMLADMAINDDPVNGLVLRTAANAIAASMTSKETFSSIMATVYERTDFLNSHALRENLKSGYDPYLLTDNNTTMFIVIPVEMLRTYGGWLRLVVTTLMRSIVRKPNPKARTIFFVDEAASLGRVDEFLTCFASYAGMGITLFPIFQDFNQIKTLYGDGWQTLLANTSVKLLFGVRDQFTAETISQMCGEKTNVFYDTDSKNSGAQTNQRFLFTPDEVKRYSNKNMFVFIDQHPVAVVPKLPYYQMAILKNPDGSNKYDPNPYIDGSL